MRSASLFKRSLPINRAGPCINFPGHILIQFETTSTQSLNQGNPCLPPQVLRIPFPRNHAAVAFCGLRSLLDLIDFPINNLPALALSQDRVLRNRKLLDRPDFIRTEFRSGNNDPLILLRCQNRRQRKEPRRISRRGNYHGRLVGKARIALQSPCTETTLATTRKRHGRAKVI